MTENIEDLKKKILFSVLEILPYEIFDGNIISKACENINIQKEYSNLLFPNGRVEVLEFFRDYIDEVMLKRINKELVNINSITAKIYESIKIRLEILDIHRIIIPKIISFYMVPWNHFKLYPYTWKSMNLIWRVAGGDKSTDFNYYTKRGLLTGVYWSTILYWLQDESLNYQSTHDFLQRELNLVVKIGRKLANK